MAFPNIVISTEANNILVIDNNEAATIYIGMQIFDVNLEDPEFVDFTDIDAIDWTATPDHSIGANAIAYSINLGLDGLYKVVLKDLTTSDTKDIFLIFSSNIDACEKAKLQDLLCKSADDCTVDDCQQIAEDLKFYALKDTLTFFYKKYVDVQGVTVPTLDYSNSESIDIATTINTLAAICGCVNQVAGGSFIVDSECGCVKYNYAK